MATLSAWRRHAVNGTAHAFIALIVASLLSGTPVEAFSSGPDEGGGGTTTGIGGVVYVDVATARGGDGSSWANALNRLQDAIDIVDPGDQVWVAAGTYTPTSWPSGGAPYARMAHFSLRNRVEVFGGFVGSETSLVERNPEDNPTVLSGDIGVVGDITDNCYHVFFHPEGSSLSSSAVLDGFTITLGNANGPGVSGKGGGVYNFMSSPTLSDVIFVNNLADEGGGLFNDTASPALTNCTIGPNMADDGAGMFNDFFSAPVLTNCVVVENAAAWNGGGVLNDYFSAPTFANCQVSRNVAGWNGGGMFNYNGSAPVLTGCTVADNFAWQGGGMYNYFSTPHLVDSAVVDNRASMKGSQMYNMYMRPTVVD